MKQTHFETLHAPLWEALEGWLQGRADLGAEAIPGAYRQLCLHLSLARERAYSPRLLARLENLVPAVHARLYGAKAWDGHSVFAFFLRDLPVAVRRHASLVTFSAVLFLVPLAASFLAVRQNPDLVNLVMSPAEVHQVAEMYGPDRGSFGVFQGATRDVAMFGYYVFNNIGIDFQCFASGLLAGVGPVFFIAFNGLHIGTVMAHVVNAGHHAAFYGFVSGHSALELTGMVLAGAGGLRLGLGILRPGRLPRLQALVVAGREASPLILGATSMTFLAAGIEAFWSAGKLLSWQVKVGVGLALWILLAAYLLLVGRRDG